MAVCAGPSLVACSKSTAPAESSATSASTGAQTPAAPPVAPVKPVTTDYYGTRVVDPYRYMENLKDPQVRAWMKAQNDYTRAVLARIPGREKLLQRIKDLDVSAPAAVSDVSRLPSGRYFYEKRLADESRRRKGLDARVWSSIAALEHLAKLDSPPATTRSTPNCTAIPV